MSGAADMSDTPTPAPEDILREYIAPGCLSSVLPLDEICGPEQHAALVAVAALVERVVTAERERDEQREALRRIATWQRGDASPPEIARCAIGWPAHEADTAALTNEAAVRVGDNLRDALRDYADPRNWGIDNEVFQHPRAVWLGPGATHRPMPQPTRVARDALAAAAVTAEPPGDTE